MAQVKVDQVYADNDFRHKFFPKFRLLRVIRIDGDHAVCEIINSGRQTTVRTSRLLRGGSRGYRLYARTMNEYVVSTLKEA